MKKRYTVSNQAGILLFVSAFGVMAACAPQSDKNAAGIDGSQSTLTLVIDSELTKALKPVNERVITSIPTIRAEEGTRIFSAVADGTVTYDSRKQVNLGSRVSGRIEKLNIQYNYQPVQKGQLIMEVYAPDLVAAQRELLLLSRESADAKMLQKARQKLALYGMPESRINQVLRSGEIAYRFPVYSSRSGYILERSPDATPGAQLLLRVGEYVTTGQSLFTIYSSEDMVAEFAFTPTLAATLQKGQKLLFHRTDAPETTYTANIGLIQPVFRDGTNFTLARVYLEKNGFRAGELLTAVLPVSRKGWWLPQSAVIDLGSRSVLFKKENGAFVAKTVKIAARMENMALIEEDLGDWEIASNAAYLVDSESFIKPGAVEAPKPDRPQPNSNNPAVNNQIKNKHHDEKK